MATTVTRLFYFSTIAQALGEGGISTGLSPVEWGRLGPEVINGTTDGAGTTLTKPSAFADYTWVSGDMLVTTSGSSGTFIGETAIASKTSSNAILLGSSIGASKTSVNAYIKRASLAGGLLDYPATLPGADTPPNHVYDNFASYSPLDATSLQPTKILRFGGAKLVGVGTDLADVLTADNPSSISSIGLGLRFIDFFESGIGNLFSTKIQLRNAGGAFGSTINDSSSNSFSDGAAAPSGDFPYYLNPGVIDGALSCTVAQAKNSLAVNLQLQQATGDYFEACSLLGVNGAILKLVYDLPSSAAGGTRLRKAWRARKR